ncbi:unnamed protein product [Kuraishia capsulata CBS 1993]|uniref:VPS4-associated protein 1 n=1 Tax=Kuraishia capsulata CBS 1993 TaxID=1382522 RepID=W6MR64_9ASCO|nr:uncharacterized protein KUCA_T00000311001 [Kuraishia capsulata CBS 1993]CDK24350.1 unnamed protein product [Kuraishia capsulata CBS 1993]
MQVPFTSIYKLRKVADTSARSCFVCYKPSVSVLVSLPNASSKDPDFFYVCEAHLRDSNFCSIRYIEESPSQDSVGADKKSEVLSIQAEVANLEKRLRRLEDKQKAAASTLNAVVGYFTKSSVEEKKDDDSKESISKELKDPKLEIVDVKKELSFKVAELRALEKRFTRYQLDPAIYRARLMKFHERQRQKEHQKFLQNPASFPSVSSLPSPGEKADKGDDKSNDPGVSPGDNQTE